MNHPGALRGPITSCTGDETVVTGRIQRSEDGQTWVTIDPQEARRKLANYYKDIDAVMAAMCDGQPVRTPYAIYRYSKEAD